MKASQIRKQVETIKSELKKGYTFVFRRYDDSTIGLEACTNTFNELSDRAVFSKKITGEDDVFGGYCEFWLWFTTEDDYIQAAEDIPIELLDWGSCGYDIEVSDDQVFLIDLIE